MGDRAPAGSTKPAGTILVVDDDARILALTGEMLRLAGYKVLKVNVASEAVLVFERNNAEIDVVLSDVQMPGLNGWELAGQLRLRSPNLPIVFMSGGTEGCAASDVLQKPFKMADFWLRISDALKRVRVSNPLERVCEMNPLA